MERPHKILTLTFILLALLAPVTTRAQSRIAAGGAIITGVPQDWTHHQLVFSNPGTEEEAIGNGTHDRWLKIVNDPRYVIQQLQRHQPGQGTVGAAVARMFRAAPASAPDTPADAPDKKSRHRDWSMDLGSGSLNVNAYPAKWSFSTTTANCASDFIAFSTGAAGSATQPTITAYNNLYS